jgi:transposase
VPKPFPVEFRRDVIAVARKGEASIAQIARDFGISESCLQRWLKIADREDRIAPPAAGARGGGEKDESAELRELRRRNQAAGAGERDPAAGDGLLRPRRALKMRLLWLSSGRENLRAVIK